MLPFLLAGAGFLILAGILWFFYNWRAGEDDNENN